MNKPKIIIFGASNGGERFLKRCGDRYHVVGFCDNDKSKQGIKLHDLEVFLPSRLGTVEYDLIVIASMFGYEIKSQLIQFGIPEAMIRFAPKSALSCDKSYRPFEDVGTLELARFMLEYVDDMLNKAGIPYYIDHGTLLGLIRDGDLLPWDDDLDISVPSPFTEATLKAIKNHQKLPNEDKLRWIGEVIVDENNERTMGIILSYNEVNSLNMKKFATSIWFMFRQDGQIRQYINSAPDHYFNGHDLYFYRGREYPIPKNAMEYLEFHYGDWRVPVKDMSLEEIRNYCPPPPNVRRYSIF